LEQIVQEPTVGGWDGLAAAGLVVVPTYNEADNLPLLVDQIMALPGFQVLVVDDNSPDGTGRVAEGLRPRYPGRVCVLHRPGKLGLGTAYVQGFQVGLEQGHRHLFQMDADFSHSPSDLLRLHAALEKGADLALGSRYASGGTTHGWPLWRLAMSRAGSLYARYLLGVPVRDLTGGFRGWRREALLRLELDSLRSRGYAFQVETAYRCARLGGAVVEVPILFAERRSGRSKMSRAIFLEAATLVWRLRLEELGLPTPLRQLLVGRQGTSRMP
jgi:dolichol-phosphate mannosyltransferase